MASKYGMFVDEDSDRIVRFIGYKNAITDQSDLEASNNFTSQSFP